MKCNFIHMKLKDMSKLNLNNNKVLELFKLSIGNNIIKLNYSFIMNKKAHIKKILEI